MMWCSCCIALVLQCSTNCYTCRPCRPRYCPTNTQLTHAARLPPDWTKLVSLCTCQYAYCHKLSNSTSCPAGWATSRWPEKRHAHCLSPCRCSTVCFCSSSTDVSSSTCRSAFTCNTLNCAQALETMYLVKAQAQSERHESRNTEWRRTEASLSEASFSFHPGTSLWGLFCSPAVQQ